MARSGGRRSVLASHVDAPFQSVGVQNATGYVVNMSQLLARGRVEAAYHSPGWLLRLDAKDGQATSVQLKG